MNKTALKCGLLPGESASVVQRMNEPLRLYLEKQLGIAIEFVIGENYAATGEALRRGELDIAYLGPATYVLQSRNTELEPFARPTHAGSTGPTFQSAIIVPEDSPAQDLASLKGQEIALGDIASTSGSWVPRHMLLKAGLFPDRDYRRSHLGAHDTVAKAVAEHKAVAGGLHLTILRRLLEEKKLADGSVRILAESRPIPEYMWVFRAGLDDLLKEDIRLAFLRVRQPETLSAYRAEAFIPAVDADADRVRYWMEEVLDARLDTPAKSAGNGAMPRNAATTYLNNPKQEKLSCP